MIIWYDIKDTHQLFLEKYVVSCAENFIPDIWNLSTISVFARKPLSEHLSHLLFVAVRKFCFSWFGISSRMKNFRFKIQNSLLDFAFWTKEKIGARDWSLRTPCVVSSGTQITTSNSLVFICFCNIRHLPRVSSLILSSLLILIVTRCNTARSLILSSPCFERPKSVNFTSI